MKRPWRLEQKNTFWLWIGKRRVPQGWDVIATFKSKEAARAAARRMQDRTWPKNWGRQFRVVHA